MFEYGIITFDEETGFFKNFITVVAYDTEAGRLAYYSNRCGVAAEYCLTAPGTDLYLTALESDENNSFYAQASGTSFAAPIVTGAIAILKGAFPYLSGAEITKLLFVTARDLGDVGVDEVYGWGMLDLERATRPVGATFVPIDNNILSKSNFALNDTKLSLEEKI